MTRACRYYNKAIPSKAMPGSIFKMVTGLAGLAEGVVRQRDHYGFGRLYQIYQGPGQGAGLLDMEPEQDDTRGRGYCSRD